MRELLYSNGEFLVAYKTLGPIRRGVNEDAGASSIVGREVEVLNSSFPPFPDELRNISSKQLNISIYQVSESHSSDT